MSNYGCQETACYDRKSRQRPPAGAVDGAGHQSGLFVSEFGAGWWDDSSALLADSLDSAYGQAFTQSLPAMLIGLVTETDQDRHKFEHITRSWTSHILWVIPVHMRASLIWLITQGMSFCR